MKKLRVGLLIDSYEMPYWIYKMIEKINSDGYAEIKLVVLNKSAAVPPQSLFARLRKNYKIFFYLLYMRLSAFISKPAPDAFANKNCRELLDQADIMEAECIQKKFSDYLVPGDIQKIRTYNIDVFIRLGFRILRGDILKVARMGIWSYHHGDNLVNRGGPAGFWEVYKNQRVIGSVLQILTEDLDGGEVLYRSWSTVHTLLEDTVNEYYWKTALFIPRKLRELHETGETAFWEKVRTENEQLRFYSQRQFSFPKNFEFLKLFWAKFFSWLWHNTGKIFRFEQWLLLYAFSDKTIATSIYRYKRIAAPKDRYWADPCVVHYKEKYYVFIEEVQYKRKNEKGHIAVLEIDRDGIKSGPVTILEQPYHLSYPFVFLHNGTYYLIPESQENSAIQLYEAVNFPFEWKFKMNLMENVKAVDTTLFFKDNKFWLFTNIQEMEGMSFSDELFLFSSDNLFTNKWQPHPGNPVISDVRLARPAGRMFYYNGKLYRPSQDCSVRYGYAVNINEVSMLNEKEYKEIKVSAITPDWDKAVVSTHTLSFDGELTVIDALVKRRGQIQ